MPKTAKLTAPKIAEALGLSVSKKGDVFTARRGFFYTHGKTAADLVARIQQEYPSATIIASGEVWKAFRGGQTTAQGSHWYVKFSV